MTGPGREPATETSTPGAPRREGDGIAVDIATPAGPVTLVLTSRDIGSARPADGAFTYQGRRYTGNVFLAGPRWDGSGSIGLSLLPGGGPAGRMVSSTIAATVGTAVAAWLREHPEIPDLAAQAQATARRARARQDLELLEMEIATAEEHLAALRRKQEQLRTVAAGKSPTLSVRQP